MIRPTLPILLLSGCWLSNQEVLDRVSATEAAADTDTDAAVDEHTLLVDDVDPAWGSNSGGSEVLISAAPLGSDTEVRFGSAVAQLVDVDVESGHIIALVPDQSVTGDVDVVVASGGLTGVSAEGFRYWEDASDRFGGIGSLYWKNYVGGYWEQGTEDYGYSWFKITEPTDVGYREIWSDADPDGCVSSAPVVLSDLSPLESGASEVTFRASVGTPFTLEYSSDEAYFFGALDGNQYQDGAWYDMDAIAGSAAWPSVSIANVAQAPAAFTVTKPDVAHDELQPVDRFDFEIRWSDAGGDYVIIDLARYSSSRSAVVEYVTCVVDDDGRFTVPYDAWNDWDALDDYIYISVGRALSNSAQFPFNNAYVGVVGVYWVQGAVYAN